MKRVVLLLAVGVLVLAACAKLAPGSSGAPLPTYTLYPTYTSVPAALPTDTPMPTVSQDSLRYETLSGNMTFAYPADYGIQSYGDDSATLTLGAMRLDVFYRATVLPSDDEQRMDILLSEANLDFQNLHYYRSQQTVDEGVWDVGVGRAYYCEFLAYFTPPPLDRTPQPSKWVSQYMMMLVLDDGQKQVWLVGRHDDGTPLTDYERDALWALAGTVRVK